MCDDGRHHGLDKHAVPHGAVEVANALDAAIIFAGFVLELDANPLADLKARLADESDSGLAAIAELHRLAMLKIWHYEQSLFQRNLIVARIYMPFQVAAASRRRCVETRYGRCCVRGFP